MCTKKNSKFKLKQSASRNEWKQLCHQVLWRKSGHLPAFTLWDEQKGFKLFQRSIRWFCGDRWYSLNYQLSLEKWSNVVLWKTRRRAFRSIETNFVLQLWILFCLSPEFAGKMTTFVGFHHSLCPPAARLPREFPAKVRDLLISNDSPSRNLMSQSEPISTHAAVPFQLNNTKHIGPSEKKQKSCCALICRSSVVVSLIGVPSATCAQSRRSHNLCFVCVQTIGLAN